jgi:NitT/TauT family transport system permease protein
VCIVRLAMSRESGRKVVVPILGISAFILVWQIASLYIVPEQSALPPPLKVLNALREMWHSGELVVDVLASLNRILFGFAIALIAAIAFGITAVRYARIYAYVKVTMDLLSSIPPIAWTPLAILWFGIGNAPAYFIVFLGAFFPVFTSVYSGITQVDRDLINAAKTLGASSTMVVKGVVFPAALPQTLTGIRTGIGVAWFNVIAAELIGVHSGLGYKIQLNRILLFSDRVMGLMLVIGVLGFLMTRFVGVVGNLITPWAIQDETRPRWKQRQRKLALLAHFFRGDLKVKDLPHSNVILKRTSLEPSRQNNDQASILVVNQVSKSFEGQSHEKRLEVLRNISFEVDSQEVFSIVGPNGSGKTTLINIVAGLLKPDSGSVQFMGKKIQSPSHQRTVVFQNFALFPWRTCRGNIEFALRAATTEKEKNRDPLEDRHALATNLLKEANLGEFRVLPRSVLPHTLRDQDRRINSRLRTYSP